MTTDELRRSLDALRRPRHSNAMEGLRECPEDAVVLDACARGEMFDDEARWPILANARPWSSIKNSSICITTSGVR
jgi:hypothetical protein